MEIGEPKRTIEVQPAVEPFRKDVPAPAPQRREIESPERVPEKVPAGK